MDIDGLYWHGALGDDDRHDVNSSRDHLRFRFVPDGVKFLVIDENKIESGLDEVKRLLSVGYDDWLNEMSSSILSMSFPYYEYDEKRLRKDYDHLVKYDYKKGQTLGLSSIRHFHKSMWKRQTVDGVLSPYEGWYDEKVIRELVRSKRLYYSKFSFKNPLDCFSINYLASLEKRAKPPLVKYVISKYLSDFDEIFDPFACFSSNALGICASGKKYKKGYTKKILKKKRKNCSSFMV